MISNTESQYRFLSTNNQPSQMNYNMGASYCDSNSSYNIYQHSYNYSSISAQSSSPTNYSYNYSPALVNKQVNDSLVDDSYYSFSSNSSTNSSSKIDFSVPQYYSMPNYSPYYYNYAYNYNYNSNNNNHLTVQNNYQSTPVLQDIEKTTPTKTESQESKENDSLKENRQSTPNHNTNNKKSKSRNILTEIADPIEQLFPRDQEPKRRLRTAFSTEQRYYLLSIFEKTIYPTRDVLEEAAKNLNVSVSTLQTWFKNTRSKQKKLTNTKNLN